LGTHDTQARGGGTRLPSSQRQRFGTGTMEAKLQSAGGCYLGAMIGGFISADGPGLTVRSGRFTAWRI